MPYNDPVITAYINLMKAHNASIQTFYYGEPLRIPASNLPCAIISKRETRVGPLNNSDDQHEMGITITIVTDIRKDLSTEENIAETVPGVSSLYDIVEGRNDDLTLKETSILSILRSNLLVDKAHGLRTDLASVTRVSYGATLRNRPAQEWSIEASVDILSTFHQVR